MPVRRDVRRIEGRAREEQVDRDVAGHLPEIARQRGRRPVAPRGQVFPDGGHAVVGNAVAVDVRIVDVPVVRPGLRPRRQVIEPQAAWDAETGLLVVRARAAPGDDLATLPEQAEVVARVGIRLVELHVRVELEVGPSPPVDEEDGIPARIDARRRVLVEPLLDARRVDEVVRPDVENVAGLAVVHVLKQRAGKPVDVGLGNRQVAELREEGLLERRVGVEDVVVVGVVDTQLLRYAVPEPRANDRVVRLRQLVEKAGLVGLARLVPDEDELDRNLLGIAGGPGRIERLKGRGGVRRRCRAESHGDGERRHDESKHQLSLPPSVGDPRTGAHISAPQRGRKIPRLRARPSYPDPAIDG
jgi:hypothetical protein